MATLARDVINNPDKYDGRVVDVVGRVSGFNRNGYDDVELEAGIYCYMYNSDDINHIKMGQKVIFRGTFKAYYRTMENCVVLKKYPLGK